MIIELVCEAEFNEYGINRIGIKPTMHPPWVQLMVLDALVRQLDLGLRFQAAVARATLPRPFNKLPPPPGS